MVPEFYNEVITITFKSDIYSLGTIIIEMLTGRKGYPDIDNVRIVCPDKGPCIVKINILHYYNFQRRLYFFIYDCETEPHLEIEEEGPSIPASRNGPGPRNRFFFRYG
jgi:serine/threonine protein kinase